MPQLLTGSVPHVHSVSQSVRYIFSSRLGLISDVWPHDGGQQPTQHPIVQPHSTQICQAQKAQWQPVYHSQSINKHSVQCTNQLSHHLHHDDETALGVKSGHIDARHGKDQDTREACLMMVRKVAPI
jgi:hypothetical protein